MSPATVTLSFVKSEQCRFEQYDNTSATFWILIRIIQRFRPSPEVSIFLQVPKILSRMCISGTLPTPDTSIFYFRIFYSTVVFLYFWIEIQYESSSCEHAFIIHHALWSMEVGSGYEGGFESILSEGYFISVPYCRYLLHDGFNVVTLAGEGFLKCLRRR